MFRPSNPSDKHLTMLELQDWERQRDEQKIDFPFIRLSRPELRLLKKSEKDWVRITDKNKRSAIRLRDLNLGRINRSESNSNQEAFELRDRGRNYLMYFRGIKLQKRIESVRYWVTTGIAVAALIISLAALLWQAYTWNYELHRNDGASFSSYGPDGSLLAEAPREPPEAPQEPHSKSAE